MRSTRKSPVTYTLALGETSEKGASVKVTSSDDKATYYCGIHTEASLLGIPDQTLLKQLAALENLSDRLHTGAGSSPSPKNSSPSPPTRSS